MANENEPAKLLLPYLQRADELQKHEPLVAYYCRLYAMERGLKIPQNERTKTTNALLVSLMKQLEKDKKSIKLAPDDNLHLEGFALNVFAKADKQDRAGRADLSTAKTFYAASIFFEILNQFGELQPDIEQKQKYAAWKAADIRKAVKEGRKPVPGPPGGDQDLSGTSSGEYDLEPTQPDPPVKPAPESDPSPQSYDRVEPQNFPKIPPSPPQNIPPSNIPPSSPYPTDDYPHNYQQQPPPTNRFENSTDDYPSSHNYHQPPPPNGTENSPYSQQYQHQPYPLEPQAHLPHNYAPHETPSHTYPNFQSYPSFTESSLPAAPSHTYPNFQSYPSFTESSLPAAPSHYPSYYQGSEASYSAPPAVQYDSSSQNGSGSHATAPPAQTYQYDSNYQPPPEKIAEAHKAARFAVGALAFDDVSIAVDYLKKSLELLTNPSAGQ